MSRELLSGYSVSAIVHEKMKKYQVTGKRGLIVKLPESVVLPGCNKEVIGTRWFKNVYFSSCYLISLITVGKQNLLHHLVPSPLFPKYKYLLNVCLFCIRMINSTIAIQQHTDKIVRIYLVIHIFNPCIFLNSADYKFHLLSFPYQFSAISSFLFTLLNFSFIHLLYTFIIHNNIMSSQTHFLISVTHTLLWLFGHLVKWTFTNCCSHFQS